MEFFQKYLKMFIASDDKKAPAKKKTFYRGIIKTVKVKIPLLFW